MDPFYKMRLSFFLIGTISAILCFISKTVSERDDVITNKLLYDLWVRQYLRFLGLAFFFLSIGVFTIPFGTLLESLKEIV